MARIMRPVINLNRKEVEYIGTLEQPFMDIACPDPSRKDVAELQATHEELGKRKYTVKAVIHPHETFLGPFCAHTGPNSILSAVATLTPWSEFNQSPRNMYQCQMAKQTMGVPVHSFRHRHDNKMYMLETPQKPLARSEQEDKLHVNEYPQGFNGIVAVISYTGYDMEDAMIVNKGSMERGLGRGTLYTSETISVAQSQRKNAEPESLARPELREGQERRPKEFSNIDADGLPAPGQSIGVGNVYATSIGAISGKVKSYNLKDSDDAYVDQVTLLGDDQRYAGQSGANIKKRFPRRPIIGDKFSSRHGQKGTLSLLYPEEDMPYIEGTGVRPDILINPNAFPSRMTIGMLIESFASKAGALRGESVDATAFKKCTRGKETSDPVMDFVELLQEEGYQKYGGETMVCGVTGELLHVDVFIGLVYYQRLRHMVSDKFQVRTLGPISNLTHQPVKGRKAGGGIRFGEMERDALIAHGASYLLHDRLHLCSDRHLADVCRNCGTFLSTTRVPATSSDLRGDPTGRDSDRIECMLCKSKESVEKVALPYVFRYLVVELAAMNVKMTMSVR
jgi:DNA-directed RNA polymerase I subunit RPA2